IPEPRKTAIQLQSDDEAMSAKQWLNWHWYQELMKQCLKFAGTSKPPPGSCFEVPGMTFSSFPGTSKHDPGGGFEVPANLF
ncbi:MAG: hypothetical protein QGH82_02090, partial [Candidatus Woesearchaeota archaeon]|nr:hypothetical protein [Candidatus Woesearchaeota archaeon]